MSPRKPPGRPKKGPSFWLLSTSLQILFSSCKRSPFVQNSLDTWRAEVSSQQQLVSLYRRLLKCTRTALHVKKEAALGSKDCEPRGRLLSSFLANIVSGDNSEGAILV